MMFGAGDPNAANKALGMIQSARAGQEAREKSAISELNSGIQIAKLLVAAMLLERL